MRKLDQADLSLNSLLEPNSRKPEVESLRRLRPRNLPRRVFASVGLVSKTNQAHFPMTDIKALIKRNLEAEANGIGPPLPLTMGGLRRQPLPPGDYTDAPSDYLEALERVRAANELLNGLDPALVAQAKDEESLYQLMLERDQAAFKAAEASSPAPDTTSSPIADPGATSSPS